MINWQIFSESFFKILIPGLTTTIPLTLISFSIAMIIAIIVAMIQYAEIKILKDICRFYIWIIRGTPLLVQLFVIFYGLPNIGILIDPFPAAIIAFSINEGAYCAETMRGALESISKGQIEAGYCCGMNFVQIMWHIVLPQALRVAFPSLFNSLISLTKDTSLASNITLMEMFYKTKTINSKVYESLTLYLEVGLVYLIFSTVLTYIQKWGEKKLGSYESRGS